MSDTDPSVQVSINADAQTGAIDIAAGQLQNLGGAASALLGPLAALGTVAGIVAFFKEAADAAEENVQALVHLQAQLSAAGLDVTKSTATVIAWAESLQQTSRFGAPELEAALARVVARTGDLAESQKLVQLAMNVSVGTGKDFNSELDILAQAAGGSARGVQQLQRELGQAAVGVTDINQLLNMLSARYQDNAEKSKTLTDSAAQTKNTFHDMAAIVGDSLHPALVLLQTVAQTLEKTFGTLWSFLSLGVKDTATEIGALLLNVVAMAETTGRILKDVATLNFKDISVARADFARQQAEITTAANESEKASAEQSNRELQALGTQRADAEKASIKSVGDFKGIEGQKDLAQEIVDVNAQVAAVKAAEQAKLAEKNQSSAQRLAIVQKALDAELALLDAHHKAWIGKEAQFQAERSKLTSEAALLNTQIEQKYLADRIAATEAWRSQHLEIMANVEAAARSMADGMATSFGQSVAKMIVEGGNLEKALHQLAIQVAEEIIAQLVRIEVEAAIAKAALLLL